ncbi:hypothetical protein ACFQZJ_02425 [Maribacter chungangensis]|uniref:Serine/threonine protein kinase n=1 Tax=Maribacter chungangensis TaxID=1069117 RepID=A0ABW3AZ09_9FLAO
METNELKELFAAYDAKLDRALQLNERSLKKIKLDKIQKQTRWITVLRSIEVVSFSILVVMLCSYIADNWAVTHLAVSGIIIHVFALIALVGSIGQLVLLQQIDYVKPIVEIRKKIEKVNSHALLFLKLVFLSAPVWWAYPLVALDYFFNIDLYPHLDPDFVLNYVVVNALLVFPLLWFLSKLAYKNLHIKWVRKTIGFFTGTKTKKALEFLNEIEEFEK